MEKPVTLSKSNCWNEN